MQWGNCPNCGGSVKHGKCEYCDTVFEEENFSLDINAYLDEPFNISCPLVNGKRVELRVCCTNLEIEVFPDGLPKISMDMVVLDRLS